MLGAICQAPSTDHPPDGVVMRPVVSMTDAQPVILSMRDIT